MLSEMKTESSPWGLATGRFLTFARAGSPDKGEQKLTESGKNRMKREGANIVKAVGPGAGKLQSVREPAPPVSTTRAPLKHLLVLLHFLLLPCPSISMLLRISRLSNPLQITAESKRLFPVIKHIFHLC